MATVTVIKNDGSTFSSKTSFDINICGLSDIQLKQLVPVATQIAMSLPAPAFERKLTKELIEHIVVCAMEAGAHNKIALIKLVRELSDLGLKDAKDLVEGPGIDRARIQAAV